MYNGKYKVKYILNKKSKENHSMYIDFLSKAKEEKGYEETF